MLAVLKNKVEDENCAGIVIDMEQCRDRIPDVVIVDGQGVFAYETIDDSGNPVYFRCLAALLPAEALVVPWGVQIKADEQHFPAYAG